MPSKPPAKGSPSPYKPTRKWRKPGESMFQDSKVDTSILEDRRLQSNRMYQSEKAVSFETSRRYNGNHPGKPAEYFSSKGRGVSGKSRKYN